MAHDLLSNGIVPACVTVHQASRLQETPSLKAVLREQFTSSRRCDTAGRNPSGTSRRPWSCWQHLPGAPGCSTLYSLLSTLYSLLTHSPQALKALPSSLPCKAEIRSERLLEFDLRPFNTLRADLRRRSAVTACQSQVRSTHYADPWRICAVDSMAKVTHPPTTKQTFGGGRSAT